jgi:hypothetical protein
MSRRLSSANNYWENKMPEIITVAIGGTTYHIVTDKVEEIFVSSVKITFRFTSGQTRQFSGDAMKSALKQLSLEGDEDDE